MLGELNTQWETRYDHKITSGLPSMVPECSLAKKQLGLKLRERTKKIATHISEQMKENAILIHLAEGESFSYHRKQYAMSYEERPAKKNKKPIHPQIKHGIRKRQ